MSDVQEFLVSIITRLPADMDPARREQIQTAEIAYVKCLHAAGTIRRIWRVPGRTASVGIWCAVDATELHDHLAGLPLFAWLEIEVRPLARHFLETGA
jgi:muconolactone D-isomerase